MNRAILIPQKLFFGGLWLGLVIYAFGFAPPDRPETLTLIVRLSSGDWGGINPWIVAIFNIMGLLPALYGLLLWRDGQTQKIWIAPFAIGMFAVGAFALLPYLALRNPQRAPAPPASWWLKLQDSRWSAIPISGLLLGFLCYGAIQGDGGDFLRQWQTSRFIHVMTLDFCLLSLLFYPLIQSDRRDRGLSATWWVALPLVGPLLYLCIRPRWS